MQMDLIYRSSMAKEKPKGECAPTTEQDEARLTDRGGQGGGKQFLWGLRPISELLREVTMEASQMAVTHLGILNQV